MLELFVNKLSIIFETGSQDRRKLKPGLSTPGLKYKHSGVYEIPPFRIRQNDYNSVSIHGFPSNNDSLPIVGRNAKYQPEFCLTDLQI